ncbi:MAG: DUF6442 family protein [Oscillospiraceae bacterium]|nr:DUF6442 family protein [Oscillospiraceae bacterium]
MSENNKAEILEKAKSLNKDEGLEFAEVRGGKAGIIMSAVVGFLLILFSLPENKNVVNAIVALSFAWLAGGTFSYYRFTKKKIQLLLFILSVIATVFYFLMAILY